MTKVMVRSHLPAEEFQRGRVDDREAVFVKFVDVAERREHGER